MFIEYRFRVHDGDVATLAAFRAMTGGAALTVSSVRGDTLPYLIDEPKGDGASIDPNTGKQKSSVFTVQIADAVIATSPDVLRVFTSQLEDASHRQKMGNRVSALDWRENGGAWKNLTTGLLTRFALSSDAVWDVTISDPTQAEHGRQTFCPQIDPATGQLETVAQFLARWPNRGCVLGGPVRGGFLNQPDRGGWEMRVRRLGGWSVALEFVAGYAAPQFKRSLNAEECARAANQKTDSLYQGTGVIRPKLVTFADAQGGTWRDLVVEVIGVGYYIGDSGLFSGDKFNFDGELESHLVKDIRRRGIYIKGSDWPATGADNGLPADGTIVRVRAFTAHASDISPIYWTGHPVDLLATLWAEAGIAYNAASIETVRGIIGASRRVSLRIDSAQEMGSLLEQVVYGPFGVGARLNAGGELEAFNTRIFNNAPPTLTIDNTTIQKGSAKPFDLDTSTAIRSVTFEHDRLVLTQNSGDESAVDGFTVQHETIERINDEPGALGTDSVNYRVPGMVHLATQFDPDLASVVDCIAAEIFDRTGRGLIAGEVTTIRGTALDALRLGDECLVNLKQLPNRNRRLKDDNTVAARAMQVVRLTPHRTGSELSLADSGPNAQPFGTVPAVTLAASAESPRRVATLTITNAAALNAAGAAVRVRMATTTGAAPAATEYGDAAYYAAGKIPAAAVALPGVQAGQTVWVIARAEKTGSRPSNYSSAASVALAAIPAPSGLATAAVGIDGSIRAVLWTPGTSDLGIQTDVFARRSVEVSTATVLRASLNSASTQYVLERLTPGESYTVGVQHREVSSGDTSALIETTFTAGSGVVTLDTPTDPTGFSGTQDPVFGLAQQDGLYGLAVAAVNFPSEIEFFEEVEIAPNTGIFDGPVSVGRVGAVQGDWTRWQDVAPNDGCARMLSARTIRDGATSSGFTDGVLVRPWTNDALGRFSEVAGVGEIRRVSETESADGKSRNFQIIVGARVATVHVHFRTVSTSDTGDVFDFSEEAELDDNIGSPKILRAPADGSGIITFSLDHPLRGYRTVGRLVPYSAAPHFKEGASWPIAIDPAPPSVSAKIHPLRVGTIANLSIDILFGVSDGPVTTDVFEDAADLTTALLTKTMTAPGTIDSVTDAALGNRTLPPGKDSLAWRVRVTDVNGQPYWFGPASANRDPLPNGTPAVKNYRANPAIVCPFDPDTDAIRYTSHAGKVRTYDAAALTASGSPLTHTVGVDAFDDLSVETALVVGETRTAAKIEYLGGGTWLEMWRGDLHGQPSNPPTADVRCDPNANRDAVDVRIRPDTQVDEKLHVYWRDGATDAALEWIACAGASDPTPLQVTAGTQLGPSNFFRRVDGVGSPVAKLSAIPALRDQIAHYGVMIEGVDSGVQSPYLDVTISVMEKPWNESFVLEWDDAAGAVVAIVAAGAHTLFETVQIADNNLFSSPTTQTAVIADGTVAKLTFPLSQAQRGKLWYGRAKPNNKNDGTGLDGEYQSGSVAVPALFAVDPSTSETASQGTLTFVVSDPGQVLDPTWTNGSITTPIHYEVLRLGVKTTEGPTTTPGGGSTTGTFTKVITLLDHPVTISAYAHLRDGSKRALGAWTFDSNKIADLKDSNVVDNGQNAEVTLTWDTDALIGSNCARYSLNNGASWTTVTISSLLVSQFTVARTSTTQQMLVQALNAIDGNWGTQSTVKVSAYLTEGPSLVVYVTPGATLYTITWTGTGIITVSIDGGAYATATSPITRFRDGSDHTYDFLAVQGGQSFNPPSVIVPALASSGGATAIAITKPTISVNTSSDTFTFSFGASPLPSGYYFTVVWHDTNAHTIDAFSLSSPTSSPVILTTSDHGYNLVAGSTYTLTGHVEAYDSGGNLRGVSQDATVNFNAL